MRRHRTSVVRRPLSVAGALAALGLLLAFATAADSPRSTTGNGQRAMDDVQDVVFLGENPPLLIRLHVRIDGRPYQAVGREAWDDYVRALFRQLDQNGDGFLSEAEAQRIPPPQMASGGSMGRPTNVAFNVRVVDDNGDGKIDLPELLAYFREYGQAGLRVSRPNPASAMPPAVNDALFRLLDKDRDGRLSARELESAEAVLMPRDTDGDGLIAPAELVPGLTQTPPVPGGVIRPGMAAASPARSPFVFLGQGDAERAKYARRRPDLELIVRLGELRPGEARLEVAAGSPAKSRVLVERSDEGTLLLRGDTTHIELRANEGRPMPVPRLRSLYLARFRAADVGKKGYLTFKEAQAAGFFPGQFALLDQNGDGRLTEKELVTYLDEVQSRQAKALTSGVAVKVSEEGRGLFELLDRNRDGKLGLREIRGAAGLLDRLGRKGDLTPTDLPRSYQVAIGLYQAGFERFGGRGTFTPRGTPLLTLNGCPPHLVWFEKMDRNHDGDVSPQEFLGSREDFRRLDANGDGLISLDEALRAAKPSR